MKASTLLILCLILFTFSCAKDDDNNYIKPINQINACKVEDPLNQIEWLHQLAKKALDDKTGNYIGSIWIITHENSDIIVTDMAMGSGGIYWYLFDCQGNQINNLKGFNPDELSTRLTDSTKIFSTAH